jgi:hypothetical protein
VRHATAGMFASVVLASVAIPKAATGQVMPECVMRLDQSETTARREPQPGRIRYYAAGDVRWSCLRPVDRGDSALVFNGGSDSLARYVELGRADFVGRARFRDSTVELTADRASYFFRDDRLEANGNVRLVNLETGSVLSGPTLTYWRAAAGVRDTSELHARRRPTVEYRSAGGTAEEPYIIRAEQVWLKGNEVAYASGAVTIDRSDFAAKGDSTWLNVDVGEGLLIGQAEAGGKDSLSYDLRGRRIAFRLVDDELEWVQAQGRADATSAEWRIVADTIEFAVANDMIQHGQIWGDSILPRAMSEQYTITADSMAVDTPDQVLTEVRAFGAGRATAKPDSLSGEADWMAGDTLVVRFDSTESGDRTISELLAAGHAQAFYRIPDEADSTAAPAFNYSRGLRIIAKFTDEEIDRVDVIGEADGVYLEPIKRSPRP